LDVKPYLIKPPIISCFIKIRNFYFSDSGLPRLS